MGKAWRCVTLEEASSFLLPWQRSLLGNSVAMARVSSVMQTWPHPPTPHQLWRSGRLYYWLSALGMERLSVCVCSFCLFGVFCTQTFFFLQTANFILHGAVSLLSAPLTHDPSPFQGGVSSPGAGTNMGCAETVHWPTSYSHSWFLVSDLFSLAVELDTQWQCALWRQTRDKTLHWHHFSSIGAETFIQREAIGDETKQNEFMK